MDLSLEGIQKVEGKKFSKNMALVCTPSKTKRRSSVLSEIFELSEGPMNNLLLAKNTSKKTINIHIFCIYFSTPRVPRCNRI
jgi:hypothetical protein